MERPDGSRATQAGVGLMAVGIVAAILAWSAETFEGNLWGLVIANLGIGLGILLLSLGYLVKAIWFLPGREIDLARNESGEPIQRDGDGFHFCDWCHLGIYAPDEACSRQSDKQIRADLGEGKAPTPTCAKQLRKRGFLDK